MLGNTELVKSGIAEETSDIRVHVSMATKSVYIYRTQDGVDAIDPSRHREVKVERRGYVTAAGFLVPPGDIRNCERIAIPVGLHWPYDFSKDDSEEKKGKNAEDIVRAMLRDGDICLMPFVERVDDIAQQISGVDLIAKMDLKIQVKADHDAGPKELGGTGNLFLQVEECNPFGIF